MSGSSIHLVWQPMARLREAQYEVSHSYLTLDPEHKDLKPPGQFRGAFSL